MGAITTMIIAGATAVGGAVSTAAGVVGGLAGTAAGALGAGTALAGGITTAATLATSGAIYGSAVGGAMAGITGGDIVEGMKGGAISGAIAGGSMGVGSMAGNFAQTSLNMGTWGQTIATGATTGAVGFGLGRAAGMDTMEAATLAASAGVMAGLNRYQTMTAFNDPNASVGNRTLGADLEMSAGQANLNRGVNIQDYVDPNTGLSVNGPPSLNSIDLASGGSSGVSILETQMSSSGLLVTALASGAQALTPVEVPLANQREGSAVSALPVMKKGEVRPMATPATPKLMDAGNFNGSGWGRTSGQLGAGTEELTASIPEAKKKTAAAQSDEILLTDGSMY